MDNPEKLTK